VKRLLAALAVVATLAGGLAVPGEATAAAPADRQAEIDKELGRLKNELSDATAEEARLAAELRVTRKHRADLDAQLAGLDAQIATAEQELAAVSGRLDESIAQELAAQRDLDRANEKLADASDLLHEQAVQAFMHFGNQPTTAEALRRLERPADVGRVEVYIDTVAERQAKVVTHHEALAQSKAELEAAATAAALATSEERVVVSQRRDALQAARSQQAAARASVQAEADNEARLLRTAQTAKAASQKQIDALKRESSAITSELRRAQAGQTPTVSGKGSLSAPLKSPVVTSTYGSRVHPIYGDIRTHTGVDFKGSTGTPVFAAADGVVLSASVRSGYGNTVIIDQGGQLATLYAHLSSMGVQAGQKVARGATIGAVGATGNVTGPHLHFEVRVNGAPVDPLPYL
jgi:murein DD-endopeptidase MepM/ murein hydrolase activator NlpD